MEEPQPRVFTVKGLDNNGRFVEVEVTAYAESEAKRKAEEAGMRLVVAHYLVRPGEQKDIPGRDR